MNELPAVNGDARASSRLGEPSLSPERQAQVSMLTKSIRRAIFGNLGVALTLVGSLGIAPNEESFGIFLILVGIVSAIYALSDCAIEFRNGDAICSSRFLLTD